MTTLALCEDNEFQRELMQGILDEYAKTQDISYTLFPSGEELLRHVKQTGSFDVYLLDVVMPGINGMEVATTLRQIGDTNAIIFLTASLEYAALSYDVNALYYLTKPLDREKLYRVLDKACSKATPNDEMLELHTKTGETRVKITDIMYVTLKERAPIYYTQDGREYYGIKLRGTFHDACAPLLNNEAFVTCGVGLVVNLKYVSVLDSESILMTNGEQLFFPKSAYSELKAAWKKFNQ